MCCQHGRRWTTATASKLWYMAGSKWRCWLREKTTCNVYDKKPQRYAKDNKTAHLTARSDKSVAYVTNNKRLYSTFCTVEANYWQTRSIARRLCDSRATCSDRPKLSVGGAGESATARHRYLPDVHEQSSSGLLVDTRATTHVSAAACQVGRGPRASRCWGRRVSAGAWRSAESHVHVLVEQTQRIQAESLRTGHSNQYV